MQVKVNGVKLKYNIQVSSYLYLPKKSTLSQAWKSQPNDLCQVSSLLRIPTLTYYDRFGTMKRKK